MSSVMSNQVLLVAVVGVLVIWSCCGDAQRTRPQGSRRRQGNRFPLRRGGLTQSLHQAYMSAMDATTPATDGLGQNMAQFMDPRWRSFTPSTPSPAEVECYIDVTLRQTVDGRCVRLGGQGQRAACQGGMHLDFFNDECETILNARAGGNGGPGNRPSQGQQ